MYCSPSQNFFVYCSIELLHSGLQPKIVENSIDHHYWEMEMEVGVTG